MAIRRQLSQDFALIDSYSSAVAKADFIAGDFTKRILPYFGGQKQRICQIHGNLDGAFASLYRRADCQQVGRL